MYIDYVSRTFAEALVWYGQHVCESAHLLSHNTERVPQETSPLQKGHGCCRCTSCGRQNCGRWSDAILAYTFERTIKKNEGEGGRERLVVELETGNAEQVN